MSPNHRIHLTLAASILGSSMLSACVSNPNADAPDPANQNPQQAFFNNIKARCGQRFEGQPTFPEDPGDGFRGQLLVAHIESCQEKQLRIPFIVGNDHSRTWIITMTDAGLQLKHDHRHEDGTPDEITDYGGTAATPGTPWQQSFPADAHTAEIIPAAATNEWSLTLSEDGSELVYYLERHSQPRFRAELQRVDD